MVLKFKERSGIHIKKANRGKFTEYCNGKVTSECIARGKRSSDPAVRKRATFAANVRKWKHLNGGTLLSELLPVYGTYKDYLRFRENPSWKTGASLGLSTLGDIATLTGAGAIVKGLTGLNKANNALKTARTLDKASQVARTNLLKSLSTLKRELQATQSLGLMDAPISYQLDRTRKLNKAKEVAKIQSLIDKNLLHSTINAYGKARALETSANLTLKNGYFGALMGPALHIDATAVKGLQ